MIKVENIEKSYAGDGIVTKAVEAINLTFYEGEFTSIVGPSGSGKSTLLNLLGTIDKPTKGSIYYGEQDIAKLKGRKLSDFRFQQIGFVFQQFHLFPTLTAIENIMAPLFARNVAFSKEDRAKKLLEIVGLEKKAKSLPAQLSGGEQQRVAIARALVNEPNWILADEPTGNLDSKNGEIIFNLLKELNKEKHCSIILITHDQALADQTTRSIRMKDGHVIEDKRNEHYV